MNAFIRCENLVKIYKIADLEVVALQGLDLSVEEGEIVALVGTSGSGKSTLLNLLGSFDQPSAGNIIVDHHNLLDMSEARQVRYRQQTVGFVWQQPSRNLLPYLTARENIELPMTSNISDKPSWAAELLSMVGLVDHANSRPEQLSGGQQQRVALAVALANRPKLLLADEPTGQLDMTSAHELFDALRAINERLGTTIMIVTHDPTVAARVDRVISIRDGRTSTEIRRQHGTGEEEWVVLDRVGRLQIPAIYVETLALRGRVRIRRESNHLSLWPEETTTQLLDSPQSKVHTQHQNRKITLESMQNDRPPHETAVSVSNLTRIFGEGTTATKAVDNVSLTIPSGSFALLKGRSGSGKTSLLNLIGGLDTPTSGEVHFFSQSLSALSEKERVQLRQGKIGFIFQTFGLLPFLSAQENVEVALRLLHTETELRQRRTAELLDLVGLATRASHRVHELSGGEQQRVGLARALASNPWLILADEPTGQLDTATGSEIIDLLRQIVDDLGTTIIVASHDAKVEESVDLTIDIVDGRVVTLAV